MANPHVDLESDVPNVGVGRALIVIFALHVVAIAAIYAHSTFFGSEEAGAESSVADKVATGPATADPVAQMTPPAAEGRIDRSSGRYIVVTGDSYSRIATISNVDETALRALNNNRPLRAGIVLDLPAELSSHPVAVNEAPAVRKPARAVAVTQHTAKTLAAPRAVVVEEAVPPRAVVVKSASSGLKDSGKRYTVKSGDTVWRIAHDHKVSSKQLLEINGIKDASKLRIGRELIIPSR